MRGLTLHTRGRLHVEGVQHELVEIAHEPVEGDHDPIEDRHEPIEDI